MPALPSALEDFATLDATQRISTALSSQLPQLTRYSISLSDKIRVYREQSRQSEGPFDVKRVSNNQSLLNYSSESLKQFHSEVVVCPVAEKTSSDMLGQSGPVGTRLRRPPSASVAT